MSFGQERKEEVADTYAPFFFRARSDSERAAFGIGGARRGAEHHGSPFAVPSTSPCPHPSHPRLPAFVFRMTTDVSTRRRPGLLFEIGAREATCPREEHHLFVLPGFFLSSLSCLPFFSAVRSWPGPSPQPSYILAGVGRVAFVICCMQRPSRHQRAPFFSHEKTEEVKTATHRAGRRRRSCRA